MIDIEKFKTDGFLYDSIENYKELINFEQYKNIKTKIDQINIKRHSKYDYWFKYKELSYMEEIVYDNLLKNDKNLEVADFVYEMSHKYQIKKIEDCNFYPTWIFGTVKNEEILKEIRSKLFMEFQKNFVCKYYSENEYDSYFSDSRLQFYDEGCEIKIHNDGQKQERICVFIYFLNTDWNEENGGHLLIYDKNNNPIKVNPIFPYFVVIDNEADLFHAVEKVKKGIKYNIVAFYGKRT